jgi:hypothetical protein
MDIQALQSFFMWCTILNVGMLVITFLFVTIGDDFLYWWTNKFFTVPRETFNTAVFCWISLYRLILIVFCIVPWIALEIIG